MNLQDEIIQERRRILKTRHSLTSLAREYKVRYETFVKWIEPISHLLKRENPDRRILTPKEVEIIIDHIGLA